MLDPFVDGRSGSGRRRARRRLCAGAGGEFPARRRARLNAACSRRRRKRRTRSTSAGPPGARPSAAPARPTAMPWSARTMSPRDDLRFCRRHGLSRHARHRARLRARRRRHQLGSGARSRQRPQRCVPGRRLRHARISVRPTVAAALAFANHWITTNRIAALGDQLTAHFDGAELRRARSKPAIAMRRLPTARRHALCGVAGAELPHAGLQRNRSHRRRLRADLQRR